VTKKEFSAGGVVVKRKKGSFQVLLVKDSYGKWTWPKGHIEPAETAEDAALREIEEETGLRQLQIVEKLGRQNYFYRLSGDLIFKTVYLFLLEATGDEQLQIQASEIQDARWFRPSEVVETVLYRGSKALLARSIERARKYLFR
jgi:8-oxo-dGTP pyrophosphatase MutT (NUDIX family)